MRVLTFFLAFAACGCLYGQRGGSPVFNALDANRDGVISGKEMDGAPAALRTLDKNSDGQLTEDEVRPAFGGRGGGGRGEGSREVNGPTAGELQETLMAFDKNKDGKLSKDELPERMQGMFDRGDTNKDGFLTSDEIAKLAGDQTAPPGGGLRGEGRGGGPGRGPGGFMRFDPLLAALDADHDGIVSAAEIANAPATLRTLDKNGDGQLTEDEVRPAFGGRGRGRGPR
jgi:Ca2+-binding EF-hand superfamily protein